MRKIILCLRSAIEYESHIQMYSCLIGFIDTHLKEKNCCASLMT
jgi:hypothetical protein